MNDTNDLTSSPNTKIWIAVLEDLSTSLSADVWSDLLELSSRARRLDLDRFFCDFVLEETRCVLPSAKYELCIRLLCIYYLFLDVVVDWCFYCAHEPRSHVYPLGTER